MSPTPCRRPMDWMNALYTGLPRASMTCIHGPNHFDQLVNKTPIFFPEIQKDIYPVPSFRVPSWQLRSQDSQQTEEWTFKTDLAVYIVILRTTTSKENKSLSTVKIVCASTWHWGARSLVNTIQCNKRKSKEKGKKEFKSNTIQCNKRKSKENGKKEFKSKSPVVQSCGRGPLLYASRSACQPMETAAGTQTFKECGTIFGIPLPAVRDRTPTLFLHSFWGFSTTSTSASAAPQTGGGKHTRM